jgi:predicted transcriptional regulator
MSRSNTSDALSLLGRREGVLRRVRSDGSRKCEILADLSASRSTLDRAIRELVDAGFVGRVDGVYHRTLAGELALEEYDRLAGRVDALLASRPLLDGLSSADDVDAALFEGATVVTSERLSPQAPLRHYVDLVDRSAYVVGFASAVFPSQIDSFRERLLDGELRSRMVITDPVFERLVSRYSDALRDGLGTGRIEIRRTRSLPPYSLVVASTAERSEVGLLDFEGNGVRGFLRNDDPAAVDWARRRIATRWREAEPIPSL